MKYTHCPICYEELDVVETTPCIDCGASEQSLEILRIHIDSNYEHDSKDYALYRAFDISEDIFCDICPYEFSTYDPEYFGFDKRKRLGPSDFQFLKPIAKPEITKDKFCSSCGMRLAFLLFTLRLRKQNYA